ncbi:MAG TPA: hypothetical protein VH063_01635 [Gaiellaceae bacterium]|jgi:hypothetical protein|nr:hypothetical protein [Gaiellaceae bacterium]
MAGWVWAVIVVAVVLVCVVAVMRAMQSRRTHRLKERFGPEYDRTAQESDGRRQAEADLVAREERHEQLHIRPLAPGARERYAEEWQGVQADFVDSPHEAVEHADALVNSVMRDRGYPMDDFDQRAADISVDHPQVVESYRSAHRVYVSMESGQVTTEDERQAMQDYRQLFHELLVADDARETEGVGTRG